MISTLCTWDEGIRAFLQNVSQKGPEPWDMSYEERRRLTLEPRVLRQLELEDEFKETCMEGIWNGMRRFARPMKDYKLSENRFYEYLLSIGISSEYLQIRLFQVFRVDASTEVDCLRVCKALYMGLTDEETSLNFLTHSYNSLPCSAITGEVERLAVLKACEQQRRTREQKLSTDLRKQQLEGVMSFYESSDDAVFDINAFKSLFFESGRHLWASSFVKPIFEAAAKYFSSPYGSFPTIPLRWTKMTVPLPYSRDVIYDADSLLLQHIELTGRDIIDKKQKRKRRPGRKTQKQLGFMQDYRAEIHLLARAHQYRLHPFALKELSDYLSGLGRDDAGRRDTLRELFTLLHKLCLTDRFIDEEKMRFAMAQQSAKDRRVSEKGASSVIPVLLNEIPRVYMDERSGEMKVLSSKYHEGDRFSALRQRYLFARRRCLRSGLFRRDLNKQSLDSDLPPLLPSIALEGIDPYENVAVLGMIISRHSEIYLEDLHGCLKLLLHEDVRPPLGIMGDGFLVVAKGQWCNGRFTVNSIDLPPAERRENTLRDIGSNYDLFGHIPADPTTAFIQEKSSFQSVIIVMSHIYLDQQSTIEKLIIFFKEMQNRTQSELADTTLVMAGDFSSTPVHYEDVSHLPEPFEGSDRYKLLLDTLATIITTHAPGVTQHAQIILIPGPNDVTSLLGVLPQPPIVSVFGEALQTKLKKVVFAPNPCRLRFFTHEIIVARRDFFRSLQESGRGFNWSSTEETRPVTSFEKVAKTLVDEAHLAPEVKDSILWKVDGALCMPILPHLLVLCDSTEQWECTYKGVRIVNPGSFSLTATFLWYTPADCECSLSSVE